LGCHRQPSGVIPLWAAVSHPFLAARVCAAINHPFLGARLLAAISGSFLIARFCAVDSGRTDSFRLFAFLDHRVSLAGRSSSDTGKGLSFSWFRTLTPDLTSVAALGYATHVAGGGTKTATLDLALTNTKSR